MYQIISTYEETIGGWVWVKLNGFPINESSSKFQGCRKSIRANQKLILPQFGNDFLP